MPGPFKLCKHPKATDTAGLKFPPLMPPNAWIETSRLKKTNVDNILSVHLPVVTLPTTKAASKKMNLGRTILSKDGMMGWVSWGRILFSARLLKATESETINHHLLMTHTILLHPKPNHLDIRRIYPKTNSSPLKMNSWETILSFSSWVSAKVSGTKSQYFSDLIHIMSNIEFQQNQRHQKFNQ